MSHFYLDIHERRIAEVFKRLKFEIDLERIPLEAEVAVTPEPVSYEDRERLTYRPVRVGELWGKKFDCGWFHIKGRIPESWKGSYVTLNLDFGGEALVYDSDGCPLVGLTNGSVFDHAYKKDHFHWLKCAKGGEVVDFWVDVGANGLFGLERKGDPARADSPDDIHGTWNAVVSHMEATRFDYDAWQLWLDLDVISSLYRMLPENNARHIQIVRHTSMALDSLPPERGGIPAVREALRKNVFSVGADPASIHVTAVGHAHIDTEWLWPERETIRKVGRTFASQIGLIDRYPGYCFGASQAQLYLYCKEHYPKLYEKVRKAIADGRWEVQGGMWVEADCNIPDGESLIRQFLYGMHFFRDEFGVIPRNLWLPDVFGYSGQLPQILKICGIDFFLTQKLSWNRYNKFPHNSFIWEGIDGSQVVSHFPPEDTYNATMVPEELHRHETNNREAGIIDEAISLFGIGDGGGGPKEEYVERGYRCADLNGCPRVHFGFAQQAMDRIAAQRDYLDVWVGELYFEMHRGTYTTQARQKRGNRRGEEALRTAEMLCATAYAAGAAAYPTEEFTGLWRHLLMCQFHDIIPGSSIHRVYEESGDRVEAVARSAAALSRAAAEQLLVPEEKALTLFNPSSTTFKGLVVLPPETYSATCNGEPVPAQTEAADVWAQVTVRPRSFLTLNLSGEKAKAAPLATVGLPAEGNLVLENERVRYELDRTLRIVSAYDKEAKRVFMTSDKPGNVVELFDDHPTEYDAWDIEEYATRMPVARPEVLSLETLSGPVRSGILCRYRLGKSVFLQFATLQAGSKRLDFETSVDWREKHKLCRASFPVDVRAPEARFEIQYGTIARSTNVNTKWQYAQFETCGHRYADLSDNQFGVALLNDSKYGYRCKDGTLSISLLRASTEPDPIADVGAHHFTYSILPHEGTLSQSDEVVASAAALNIGVFQLDGLACPDGIPEMAALPVEIKGEGVELAALKKAEDGDDLIIRLVERRGNRTTAKLDSVLKGCTVTPCLASEFKDIGESMTLPATLSLLPFQILTLRLSCGKENG